MSDPTSTDIKNDSEPWSILENLILAQAIYKCGDTNWVAIARTIKGHPQIHRSSNFFSQKSCATQYTLLLENLEAEKRRSKSSSVSTFAPRDASPVVSLAGQLYGQRLLEIRAQIIKDEERFKALIAELDEIRQGKWDIQLEEQLKKEQQEAAAAAAAEGTSSIMAADTEPTSEPTATAATESSASTSASTPATQSAVDQAQTSNATTHEATKLDEVDSTMEDTAPSSLSSPSSSAISDKPEDSTNSDAVQTPDIASVPSKSTAEAVPNEPKDIEMEDVQDQSIASTPAPTVGDGEGSSDVEMAEATQEESSNATPDNVTPSATSTPNAVEPENPVESKEDLDSKTVPSTEIVSQPAPDVSASIEVGGASISATESTPSSLVTPKDNTTAQVQETDDEAMEEDEPQAKKQKQDLQSSSEIGIVKSEEVEPALGPSSKVKTEPLDEAVKQEHVDEGATSGDGEEEEEEEAEDETTASQPSKTGRKPPKKIKTATIVPNKRKRRGRGADAEEGYVTSDSETTDSAHTNLSSSDQLLRTQLDDKKWKKILTMIWTDIANHRYGAVFMHPIKEQDAPGYYLMIKRPMDLKSIKERIRDGQISNAEEFHRDVLLMFMNALMYNGEETEVYQMALAMMTEVEFIIKNFKSSQSFAPAPPSSSALAHGGGGNAGGSGNTSLSTTPTTRSAPDSAISTTGPGGSLSSSTSSRRRKSSGLDAE